MCSTRNYTRSPGAHKACRGATHVAKLWRHEKQKQARRMSCIHTMCIVGWLLGARALHQLEGRAFADLLGDRHVEVGDSREVHDPRHRQGLRPVQLRCLRTWSMGCGPWRG
jgi:hypothetical protein